jgi:hypothetical protein
MLAHKAMDRLSWDANLDISVLEPIVVSRPYLQVSDEDFPANRRNVAAVFWPCMSERQLCRDAKEFHYSFSAY